MSALPFARVGRAFVAAVVVVLVLTAFLGCLAGEVEAQGPFVNSPTSSVTPPPPIVPPFITPSAGSQTGGITAPAPSSPSSTKEPPVGDMQSQPPGIVLDLRPGTGSKSPTGAPATQTPPAAQLAPEVLALLAQLLAAKQPGQPGSPAVNIGLTPPAEISQSLSDTLSAHKWLAWGALSLLSLFAVGKVGPLGVRAGSGLLSVIAALSRAPATLAALEKRLLPPSTSPADSPAAPSSTPPPGT